jgi:microcystin-dependent protein
MALETLNLRQAIEETNDASTGVAALPIGTIALWPSSVVPSGWLECDGTLKVITDYPDLYNALTATGTVFPYGTNSGDSFRLPNFLGRVAIGAGAGTGLTTRSVGDWGGSETIPITNDITSHQHTMSHTHTMPHTHPTDHFSTSHTYSHQHTVDNHNHSVTTVSNAHTHGGFFANQQGPGTAVRRNQTSPGPLNAVHVASSGSHNHTSTDGANPDRFFSNESNSTSASTGDASPAALQPAGGTSNGPNQTSTSVVTGPDTSISVVQSSYILKHIIKW